MERAEAIEKFRRGKALYRAGDYRQALAAFDALDAAVPGTRHVMYARARCLAHFGRTFDALTLCDEIIERFNCFHARTLRDRIWEDQFTPAPPCEPLAASDAVSTEAVASDGGAAIPQPVDVDDDEYDDIVKNPWC